MKNLWLVIVLVLCAGFGFWLFHATQRQPSVSPTNQVVTTKVEYHNEEYGFVFSLPETWKGFRIATGTWAGNAESGVVAQGSEIFIRHPLSTEEHPRQDIPILIFTLSQWRDLSDEKFHVGAAPIGPTELGRNATYVFALPARYNFAFPEGFEEVEEILSHKPLVVK